MFSLKVTEQQLALLHEVLRKEVVKQSGLIDRELVDQYSNLDSAESKNKHIVGKHIETGKIYRKVTSLLSELK